ncbi:TadE/TadG family type IV pilus assembly protein [Blastococcus sp. TF02A_35]|uniref:TadE/TadG family type IV pilus assembly protein n=1 Tax=Blastococcus sp. TF02A-35 TaxID=2559612 RepID=UPI0010742BA3|nr:TadE/TadG family type IV pilus assembly protein [Blastococcus sp. TF02A_35]TFV51942.1 pilus assembly protein [Blastococcus sp. TF02A_35]
MWSRLRDERGASAVEFAFVVPLLLLLVLGIAEFGRAFQVQGTISAAAREGVRTMALQDDRAAARAAVRNAAGTLDPAITDLQIAIPQTCAGRPVGSSVELTITYEMPFLTDFFGTGLELTGRGVMRCNG